MLTAEVYVLVDGHDTLLGSISWDGERLVLDPEGNESLQRLVATLPEEGDGEAFVRDLHFLYDGTYLHATRAVESEETTPE